MTALRTKLNENSSYFYTGGSVHLSLGVLVSVKTILFFCLRESFTKMLNVFKRKPPLQTALEEADTFYEAVCLMKHAVQLHLGKSRIQGLLRLTYNME